MSDLVLQDQGEPTGLSSNETAIYPDSVTGSLRSKKGTAPSKAIDPFTDHSQLTLDDGTNPHGTTKIDVGLGDVENTSNADSGISTATQLALDDKYNSSNPDNFNTPSQLNVRDSANRDRANHTSTQTASTISNFSATVRSTLLSGISIVNLVVTSADSILSAIGKLQGQINNISFTKIVFSDYIPGVTSSPTTTAQTSGTSTVISEMTKTFTPQSGTNKIEAFFSGTFGEDGTNKDETVFIGVFIDNTLQSETVRSQTVKGDSETEKIGSLSTQWQGSLNSSSHTLDIRFWIRGAGGATAVAIDTKRSLIIKEVDE